MRRALALVAPALIPSWRFFDAIGPSPRLQYMAVPISAHLEGEWHDLPLVPDEWSPGDALLGLVHNPVRNDLLFLASCCARLVEDGSDVAEREIVERVIVVAEARGHLVGARGVRFRVHERAAGHDGGVHEQLAYDSAECSLRGERPRGASAE